MKAERPFVTVVIPTYNRRSLLADAVESVLSQEEAPPFELIVVDDGSDDGTEVLLAGYGDERLRPLRIDHSGMPGLVRNRGVAISRGRYLAFLDSDDLWEPAKLKIQTALMEGDTAARITHTRERWLRNGRLVSQKGQKHRRSGWLFDDSLLKCIIGPSTVMMRRSLFEETGGFREDIEIGEDYEYWLRITSREQVGYIDLPLAVKRAGHGDQLTEKYGHIEYFRIRALADLVDSGFFTGARMAAARRELSRKCRIYAAGARKRGRGDEAERYEALAERVLPRPGADPQHG